MEEVNKYYVNRKYQDFKEEISNYACLDLKLYATEVIPKIMAYNDTMIVRTMINMSDHYTKYGYPKGTRIGLDNLLSIVLYTDFTALCSDFSSTFRKRSPFELLGIAKRRNSKYWWFSKTLLETIQVFGESRIKDTKKMIYGDFCGPFYCGMSTVMKIPEFYMFLASPTSTSIHIEVAIRFGGDSGIIIEFNNEQHTFGEYVKGTDVSWISRYQEESELCVTKYIVKYVIICKYD